MRLTVIRVDNAVYKNGVGYDNLDLSSVPTNVHALQWNETQGWLEFVDGQPNESITELPTWTNDCLIKWDEANAARLSSKTVVDTLARNKRIAKNRLSTTDWTTIPDISNPEKNNPYLTNADEFVAYRNILRQYAINPVEGEIDFPILPKAIWKTV
jgi:hypothetical protein